MPSQHILKSAFQSEFDTYNGSGKRPVVFDIIGPDRVTSLLPPDLKMVLHVNPTSMGFAYAKTISRQQTMAGFVEYHWGSNPTEITFSMATGGFMRLYSGLSNTTGPTPSNDKIMPANMRARDVGGTRRDTIAYDKYLDLLALFHSNGAIYDSRGTIAFQGQILITYDEGSWWGWFSTFTVEEAADKPYQFTLTASFTVERELHRTKSVYIPRDVTRSPKQAASDTTSSPRTPQEPNPYEDIDEATAGLEEDLAAADRAVPAPARRGHRARTSGTPSTTTSGSTIVAVVPPAPSGGGHSMEP